MIGYPEARKAWWLTRGMARTSGVNLSTDVLEGWLQRNELLGQILCCAACCRNRECEAWFSRSGSACRIPEFCPNKTDIEALGWRLWPIPSSSAPGGTAG